MQIGQQRRHLRFRKAAREAGHLALARKYQATHLSIRCRSAAGQFRLAHRSVNVRRRGLQCQVVLFVAVRAVDSVEMPPFRLLQGEFLLAMTPG